LQAVLLSFFEESFAADAKDFSGFRDVVASGFQGLRDGFAFEILERTEAGQQSCAAGRGTNAVGKIFELKFVALGEDRGAFDGVAEFA
jgi:hypothetical protein